MMSNGTESRIGEVRVSLKVKPSPGKSGQAILEAFIKTYALRVSLTGNNRNILPLLSWPLSP